MQGNMNHLSFERVKWKEASFRSILLCDNVTYTSETKLTREAFRRDIPDSLTNKSKYVQKSRNNALTAS